MRPNTFVTSCLPFGAANGASRRGGSYPARRRRTRAKVAAVATLVVACSPVVWAQGAWASLQLPSGVDTSVPSVEVGVASDSTEALVGTVALAVDALGQPQATFGARYRAAVAGLVTLNVEGSLRLDAFGEGVATSLDWGATASLAAFSLTVEGVTTPRSDVVAGRLEARLPGDVRGTVEGSVDRGAAGAWNVGVSIRRSDVAPERDGALTLTAIGSDATHATFGVAFDWIEAKRRAPEVSTRWGWVDVGGVSRGWGSPSWGASGTATGSEGDLSWSWTVQPWAVAWPRAEVDLTFGGRRGPSDGPVGTVHLMARWVGDALTATTTFTFRVGR